MELVVIVAKGPATLPAASNVRNPDGSLKTEGKRWAAVPLIDGPNDIDPDYWAWCKKNQGVQSLLDSGRICEAEDLPTQAKATAAAAKKGPDPETGLRELSIDIAKTFIHACDELTVLRRWLSADRRRAVRAEITRRINDVEGKDGDD